MSTSVAHVPGAPERRAVALALFMVALALLGAVRFMPGAATLPAPCPAPARADRLLRCDGAGTPPRARAWLAGGRLDVNSASRSDLEAIPGIGPALAGAIVDERARRGRFASFEQLDDVDGIGEKTLVKLRAVLEAR